MERVKGNVYKNSNETVLWQLFKKPVKLTNWDQPGKQVNTGNINSLNMMQFIFPVKVFETNEMFIIVFNVS